MTINFQRACPALRLPRLDGPVLALPDLGSLARPRARPSPAPIPGPEFGSRRGGDAQPRPPRPGPVGGGDALPPGSPRRTGPPAGQEGSPRPHSGNEGRGGVPRTTAPGPRRRGVPVGPRTPGRGEPGGDPDAGRHGLARGPAPTLPMRARRWGRHQRGGSRHPPGPTSPGRAHSPAGRLRDYGREAGRARPGPRRCVETPSPPPLPLTGAQPPRPAHDRGEGAAAAGVAPRGPLFSPSPGPTSQRPWGPPSPTAAAEAGPS